MARGGVGGRLAGAMGIMDGEGRLRSGPYGGSACRQAGGEKTVLLGGGVPGYGTVCRRRGGRTDADPFRYLQYLEWTERRFGIGVAGYGKI